MAHMSPLFLRAMRTHAHNLAPNSRSVCLRYLLLFPSLNRRRLRVLRYLRGMRRNAASSQPSGRHGGVSGRGGNAALSPIASRRRGPRVGRKGVRQQSRAAGGCGTARHGAIRRTRHPRRPSQRRLPIGRRSRHHHGCSHSSRGESTAPLETKKAKGKRDGYVAYGRNGRCAEC